MDNHQGLLLKVIDGLVLTDSVVGLDWVLLFGPGASS